MFGGKPSVVPDTEKRLYRFCSKMESMDLYLIG